MANPHKLKGDRFERKALAHWVTHTPDLLVARPERELGAGRADDKGDLKVLPDVAVQVKAHKNVVRAMAQAATSVEHQKVNREVPLGVGMVPVPNARATTVNWLMCALHWPTRPEPDSYLVTGLSSAAAKHVRDDRSGIPRHQRIALVKRRNQPPMWVGTFEAWVSAYRTSHKTPIAAV